MKKMIFIAAGLAAGWMYGALGDERIRPTHDIPNFSVSMYFVSEDDISQKCEALGVPYESNGCNAFYSPRNHCDIYVVRPRSVGDEKNMAIIGHELMHCRFGKYHE